MQGLQRIPQPPAATEQRPSGQISRPRKKSLPLRMQAKGLPQERWLSPRYQNLAYLERHSGQDAFRESIATRRGGQAQADQHRRVAVRRKALSEQPERKPFLSTGLSSREPVLHKQQTRCQPFRTRPCLLPVRPSQGRRKGRGSHQDLRRKSPHRHLKRCTQTRRRPHGALALAIRRASSLPNLLHRRRQRVPRLRTPSNPPERPHG